MDFATTPDVRPPTIVPTPDGAGRLVHSADGSPVLLSVGGDADPAPYARTLAATRRVQVVTVRFEQMIPARVREKLAADQALPHISAATRPAQLFLLREVPADLRALVVAKCVDVLLPREEKKEAAAPPPAPGSWAQFYHENFQRWYDHELRTNPRRIDTADVRREAQAEYDGEVDPGVVVAHLVERYRAIPGGGARGRFVFAETAGAIAQTLERAPYKDALMASLEWELRTLLAGKGAFTLNARARGEYLFDALAAILCKYVETIETPEQRYGRLYTRRINRLKTGAIPASAKARFDARYLEEIERLYEARKRRAEGRDDDSPPPPDADLRAAVALFEREVFDAHQHSLLNYMQAAALPIVFLDSANPVGASAAFFRAKVKSGAFAVRKLHEATIAHLWPEFAMNTALSAQQFGYVVALAQKVLYRQIVELLREFLLRAVPGRRAFRATRAGPPAENLAALLVDPRKACRAPNSGASARRVAIPLGDLVICYSGKAFTCHSETEVRNLVRRDGAAAVNPDSGKPFPAAFIERIQRRLGIVPPTKPKPASTKPKPASTKPKPATANPATAKPATAKPATAKPASPKLEPVEHKAPTVVCLRRTKKEGVVQGCSLYIGRAWSMGGWRLKKSKWANPFSLKKHGLDSLEMYRQHVLARPDLVAALPELGGHVLGCWCKGRHACHGDVLVELYAEYVVRRKAPSPPKAAPSPPKAAPSPPKRRSRTAPPPKKRGVAPKNPNPKKASPPKKKAPPKRRSRTPPPKKKASPPQKRRSRTPPPKRRSRTPPQWNPPWHTGGRSPPPKPRLRRLTAAEAIESIQKKEGAFWADF